MGFEDSLLALYLGSHAPAAHARGCERILSAGQSVPASHPEALHVVLAGTAASLLPGWRAYRLSLAQGLSAGG